MPSDQDPQPDPEVVDVERVATAVVAGVVEMSAIADFFDRSFSTLPPAIASQGAAILGPAFARYHGPPGETADLEVGFPTDRAIQPDGDVRAGDLPAGRAARLTHLGGYDQLGSAWARLSAWIEEQGLTATDVLWEVYVTEPSPDMDPADLRTDLYWSLAS